MENHHINAAGEFQNDKPPILAPDNIRLNLKNPRSERALRALAEDYKNVDNELANALIYRLNALHGKKP